MGNKKVYENNKNNKRLENQPDIIYNVLIGKGNPSITLFNLYNFLSSSLFCIYIVCDILLLCKLILSPGFNKD